MNKTIRSYLLVYSVPALIVLVSLVLARSSILGNHPEIAIGILMDLTVLMPLLYILMIWRKPIPKITIVPVFVLGFIISSILLKGHLQTELDFIQTFILPLVELAVIGAITYVVIQTRKELTKLKGYETELYENLRLASFQVLNNKRLSNVLVM